MPARFGRFPLRMRLITSRFFALLRVAAFAKTNQFLEQSFGLAFAKTWAIGAPARSAAFAKTLALSGDGAGRRFGGSLCVLLVLGFGGSPKLEAQGTDSLRQALGEWRIHPSFERTLDVAAGADFLAYAAQNAILLRYHDDAELRILDKSNALRQADPQVLAINPVRPNELLIAYRDGGIEVLVDEQSVFYSNAIASAQIIGRRGINGLQYVSADVAIVAADFGFLIFDVARGLFLDDVRFGSSINDVAVLNGDLYLATSSGLRRLRDYKNQSTLRDTSRYENLNDDLLGGLESACTSLATLGDQLYAGFGEDLYALRFPAEGPQIGGPLSISCGRFSDLSSTETELLALVEISANCGQSVMLYRTVTSDFVQLEASCASAPTGVALGPGGHIGIAGTPAGEVSGTLMLANAGAPCTSIAVEGPGFHNVFDVVARDGVVAIAAGGLTPQDGYTFNRNGVSVLRDGDWVDFNASTRPLLNVDNGSGSRPADFIAAGLDKDGVVYGGAFYEGLYAFPAADPATDQAFDERNSSLRTHVEDPARVRIGGLTFDDSGNLWVSNYGARAGLSVRTPTGEWTSFDVNACGATRNFRDLVVVQRLDESRIVYAIETGRGVVALDPGNLADASDDRCARISTNAGLVDPDVRSIAVDRQGDVWLGTNSGIAIINGDPFDVDFQVFVPLGTATVDSIRGNLFDGTPIQAIAVDGGNRKWLGTPNGLFLIDDGENEQLEDFDADNSPLPESNVKTLSYDGSTGMLWIGGENGLASLQTNSTQGEVFSHGPSVEVFPQPVRPDYDGPIWIRGLGQDSDVKITDPQGRLVYETIAIGGSATWDGLDYNGRRPASGVYFIWATVTPNLGFGKAATVVGKIALLR